jgi:hypothetical protein
VRFGTTVDMPEPPLVAPRTGERTDTPLLVAVIASALLVIAAFGFGRLRRPRSRPHPVTIRSRRTAPPDDDAPERASWRTLGTVYTTRPTDPDRTMLLSAITPGPGQ